MKSRFSGKSDNISNISKDNNMSKDKKEDKQASKTPLETAYAYLGPRMRTSAEVSRHLKDKGYSPEECAETVRELTGLGYIDDYQYALRYFEYNKEKRRGSLRAERELAEKGVDTETIRNAKEDFFYSSGTDENEDALNIARRELEIKLSDRKDIPAVFDERMAAAVARRLQNRGFARDTIFRVLDRLRSEYSGKNDE